MTERFTRVSRQAINYEATIVDPQTYQDKIVLSFPMARFDGRVYEFACHESNYSMPMITIVRVPAKRRNNHARRRGQAAWRPGIAALASSRRHQLGVRP